MIENKHDISIKEILKNEGNEIELIFHVSGNSDFFNGHFPEYKIFPAVGQFNVVSELAFRYFGIKGFVSKMSRVKFIEPVLPENDVLLLMKRDESKKSVSFTLKKVNDEEGIFSSGVFFYSEAE